MKLNYIPFVLISLLSLSFTQAKYEKTYPQDFRSPVDHELRLSGNFGELRPNHFHAGLDIKPNKPIGDNIYSIGDGHISRIKIKRNGYGNAVYIDHPNGYTSVYAHLVDYSDKITDFIQAKQYEAESFEIDYYPQPGEVTVSKGEILGGMGTTGRSFGVHLHFEIRDTESEKPVNPILFGLYVEDKVKPLIKGLNVYNLDVKHSVISSKYYTAKKVSADRYEVNITGNTISAPAWRVGLALKTYDQHSKSTNLNGVYTIDMDVDGEALYRMEMETFSFDESRYINAHMDYEAQQTKSSYFHKTYRMPGNHLGIYEHMVDDGVIKVYKDQPRKVTFKVSDIDGNTVYLDFNLKRAAEVATPKGKNYNYIIPHDEGLDIRTGSVVASFEPGSFYEDLFLKVSSFASKYENVYSSVTHLGESTTPVHKYYDLTISPNKDVTAVKDKIYAKGTTARGNPLSYVGEWTSEGYKINTRGLGKYYLTTDNSTPTISTIKFSSDIDNVNQFRFKISDEGTGIGDYDAYIDDKWVMIKYDQKNAILHYDKQDKIAAGKHIFKLVVKDKVGNTKTIEKPFTK